MDRSRKGMVELIGFGLQSSRAHAFIALSKFPTGGGLLLCLVTRI